MISLCNGSSSSFSLDANTVVAVGLWWEKAATRLTQHSDLLGWPSWTCWCVALARPLALQHPYSSHCSFTTLKRWPRCVFRKEGRVWRPKLAGDHMGCDREIALGSPGGPAVVIDMLSASLRGLNQLWFYFLIKRWHYRLTGVQA